MGVPAGRQLDGAAGREAGTDERVESGLTTFLTPPDPISRSLLLRPPSGPPCRAGSASVSGTDRKPRVLSFLSFSPVRLQSGQKPYKAGLAGVEVVNSSTTCEMTL
jgi:hypothetical protein